MSEENLFRNKKILVTGGAGSIGRVLVKRLLDHDPAIVRVFDTNETGLFDLGQEANDERIRPLIGDVRDRDRLIIALDGIDIVFHAAALKHVPLCEYNPFDAVKTNVIGTQNVLEASLLKGVNKVINVSTDKAVSPANVMGATKLLAERLTISANYYSGGKKTVFSSVRFGNVLNSRGSVIPVFHRQVSRGGPVTVTSKGMTRFFMDLPAAADLILRAGQISRGREIFILKMPAIHIMDLAEVMVETLAPCYGHNPSSIKINIIGRREGEKLDEELMTGDEAERAYERDDMFMILPRILPFESPEPFERGDGFTKTASTRFSSRTAPKVSREEIRRIITAMNLPGPGAG